MSEFYGDENSIEEREPKWTLVTGGAGYIGSFITLSLLESGRNVLVLTSPRNNRSECLRRIAWLALGAKDLTSESVRKRLRSEQADICDSRQIELVFQKYPNQIECVVHCAASKGVGSSMKNPLQFYQNNTIGSMNLIQCCEKYKVFKFAFMSTSNVYGESDKVPFEESDPALKLTNVYAQTKFDFEQTLNFLASASDKWQILSLRVFNPIGAHPSGLLGEETVGGCESSLLSILCDIANGKRQELSIFGTEYPSHDGTAVRDYVHVMDVGRGIVCAIDKLQSFHGYRVYNLGRGIGSTLLDVVQAFENASQTTIPRVRKERRKGDMPTIIASINRAKVELGWDLKCNSLDEMASDHWRFAQMNPKGYEVSKATIDLGSFMKTRATAETNRLVPE